MRDIYAYVGLCNRDRVVGASHVGERSHDISTAFTGIGHICISGVITSVVNYDVP